MWRRAACAALVVPLAGGVAWAQEAVDREAGRAAAVPAAAVPGPGRAFLLSAAVPGAGQRELGLERWVPYLAFEAWHWLRYVDSRADGRELEARYRDLAWTVARLAGAGARRDGGFEYYEALAKFAESGAFDADPLRSGVQPERSETTYNGSIWALARALYFPADVDTLPEAAPEYRLALDYYLRHAITAEFTWSWRGAESAHARYRGLMRASDEAFRSAARALGLILANHVVSAVDALVSARLRGRRNAASPVNLESATTVRGGRIAWSAAVRIAWPRR